MVPSVARWGRMRRRGLLAAAAGASVALALVNVSLVLGCPCLQEVAAGASPLVPWERWYILCAYLASTLFTSATVLGLAAAAAALRDCPRCLAAAAAGLAAPRLAALTVYALLLYTAPGILVDYRYYLVLSVATQVARFASDIYAAQLAAAGSERLEPPSLRGAAAGLLVLAASNAAGSAVGWLAGRTPLSRVPVAGCGSDYYTLAEAAGVAAYYLAAVRLLESRLPQRLLGTVQPSVGGRARRTS